MQTLITVGVVSALGIFVMVAWRSRARRLTRTEPKAPRRRDIRARDSTDIIWSAGALEPEPTRAKQTVAWVGIASVSESYGGCSGCGGCGCGG
jgi:hypothetical protein